MAFAFYLRNEGDFRQFYWLMKRGKDRYGMNWPFSLMDTKVMDQYFQEYKDKQSSMTMDFKQMNLLKSNPLDESKNTEVNQEKLVHQRSLRELREVQEEKDEDCKEADENSTEKSPKSSKKDFQIKDLNTPS